MADLIKPETAQEKAKKLKGWSVLGGGMLTRVYKFKNFKESLEFVNKVGELVDKATHSPDIVLSDKKVVLTLTTHSANGLTKKDFDLAANIDSK